MISGKFGVDKIIQSRLFFYQDTYYKMLSRQQCYPIMQEVENQINNMIGINKEPG